MVNAISAWLNYILGPILEKYGFHLELSFNLIKPRQRRALDGSQPELDIGLNLGGDIQQSDDFQQVGQTVQEEVVDEIVSAESDGEFIDETQAPEVEELDLCSVQATSTICEPDRVGAMIPFCALPSDATPYLGSNQNCVGTVNGDYIIFEASQNCPITTTINDTHIYHSGSVNWVDGHRGSIISRQRTVKVDFSCVFETSFTLSIADGITPLIVKADIDLGREQGVVDLSLGLWESSDFSTPLATDAVIEVPDNLYVGAVLTDGGALNTILENCWATPR